MDLSLIIIFHKSAKILKIGATLISVQYGTDLEYGWPAQLRKLGCVYKLVADCSGGQW